MTFSESTPNHLSRRDALRLGGLAALAGAAGGLGAFIPRAAGQGSKAVTPALPTDAFIDLFMNMNVPHQVRSAGAETLTWKYEGVVTEGEAGVLTPGAGYLGPTFRLKKGQHLNIRMVNNLNQPTITHWHGLDVPAAADGHAAHAVAAGAAYHYQFQVTNRAGMYWYHPHPEQLTGSQVARGLAGLMIVTDSDEQRLALPTGAYDLPLVIQDRRFNTSNQFQYSTGPAYGFLGTSIIVNGRENYVHSCAQRVYRLRLLNASNSRIYKLVFSDGTPMVVLGGDGGLLQRAVTKPYVMLSPGERVDLWVDFRAKQLGQQITLRSLAFNPLLGNSATLPLGAVFDVCAFSMNYAAFDTLRAPPPVMGAVPKYQLAHAINANNPRRWDISFDFSQGHFLLNGAMFNPTAVLPNEIVRADTLEVLEFNNPYNGGIAMPHPIHLHGRQFQVLDRTLLEPALTSDYENVRHGFLDEGWKDTILVWPGERVRILKRWSSYRGLFMYHCHNLEHEDMHMMRNFRIDP